MAYCVNGCWSVLSNVGIGTDDFATYHPGFMSPSLNIVGSRPGINLQNNGGTLSTIRLTGTAGAGEMHINFDGSSCTNGGLYFYTYGCANRSVLTIGLNGNVGIGISIPFSPHNGNGLIVKGNGSDTRGIIELHDGGASGGKSVLQQIGGDTYLGQLAKGTGAGNLHFLTGGNGGSAAISMTLLCNGRVGIGTTSPSTMLQVCGNVSGENAAWVQNTNSLGYGSLRALNNLNCAAVFGVGGSAVGTPYANTGYLYTDSGVNFVFSIGTTEKMRINSGGNVGIGTSIPDSKLHICNAVAGGTNNYSLIIQNACTVADARSGIAFSNNGQTPSAGGLSGASIQTSNNGIDGTGNLLFGTLLSGTNTERMRISHNGNIGMGTSSPADKLHVIGADNGITICSSSANRPVFSLYNGSSLMLKLSANGVYGAIADNSGSDVMYFKGGCVSIGTSSPSYKLHVNGTFYSAGSSVDYKEGICNYNTDSCLFMCLKPVTYQYKDEYTHLGKELKSETQIGLIAEDVAEVYPELAILVNEDEQKVVRNVDYEKLSIILLSEVQKLRKEVDNLKNNK